MSTNTLSAPVARTVWPAAPYKGLDYFHSQDAPLFCERDAEAAECAAFLGHYETRILLLHGRTGIGKSSFLRAGLVPKLELLGGFSFLHADPYSQTPTFIRCTDNPVRRIRRTIEDALTLDYNIQALELRNKAKAALGSFKSASGAADNILQTLELICGVLKHTLVLLVDQCEEVITLQSGSESRTNRDAFFYLLEELCLTDFDVRIIAALRTEYFGQFCDSFKVNPTSKLTPIRAGLEPYMLRGIRDAASIKNAILRPTLTHSVGKYGAPRERYKFEYGAGVVDQITQDLIEHCGESSILPILQIVCKNLYEEVVLHAHRSKILMTDYVGSGRVKGTLDAYIDKAILGVLAEVGSPSGKALIDGWRRVLATLVGRQEGGSVTTLIKKESVLVTEARDSGLTHEVEKTLAAFASDKWGLLRAIAVLDPEQEETPKNYSLGHDALAIALCQWNEAYEQVAAERQRFWRRTGYFIYGLLAACACVLGLLLLITFQQFLNEYRDRKEDITRVTKYIDESQQSDFRVRLLLLVAALKTTEGFLWSYVFSTDTDRLIDRLRDTLLRSPVWVDNVRQASGLDQSGTRLSLLNADGKVSIYNISSDKFEPEPTLSTPGNILASWNTGVGFANGVPVVIRDGILYSKAAERGQKVNELVPPELKNTQLFPDIAGGAVRLQLWNANEGVTDVTTLRTVMGHPGENASESPAPPQNTVMMESTGFARLPWTRSRRVPTLSDVSSYAAYLVNKENGGKNNKEERELMVQSLSDPYVKTVLGNVASVSEPGGAPSGSAQTMSFVSSLAFSQDGSAVISHSTPDRLEVFPLDAKQGAPLGIRISSMKDFAPGSWPQSRPLLAATKIGEQWRFAWFVVPQRDEKSAPGLVVVDAHAKASAAAVRRFSGPLLTGLENGWKLNFSRDGGYLTIQQRASGRNQVRVFNLTDERRNRISDMTNQKLQREACEVAARTGESKLQQFWMTIFFGENGSQPCQEANSH
jgi:hypothetical protein